MRKDGRAVAFYMLIEAQPQASFGQHAAQRGLADFQRITPQVVAELDQIEGVEEYAAVGALMTNKIERGHAVVVASHRFAIEDARARAQAAQRFDDQREAAGEVVARPRIEPQAWPILAGEDPEPVVFKPAMRWLSAAKRRSAARFRRVIRGMSVKIYCGLSNHRAMLG